MIKKRVVITGLGVVSSIGIGKEDFWAHLKEGRSGISPVSSFDTSRHQTHNAGEIKNFSLASIVGRKPIRAFGRCSELSLGAVELALNDARISAKDLNRESVGVFLGTTLGEVSSLEQSDREYLKNGIAGLNPVILCQYPAMNIVEIILDFYALRGPARIFTTACAAGNYAIGAGYDLIRQNEAEVVLAGGADPFSYIAFTGFNQLRSYAPEKCQPFDKNRKGILLGEGAGMLVLETLERALARKADIYAEVLGYGLSCDAFHMTNTQSSGIYDCIKDAVCKASIGDQMIDYICAHGTGTPYNDRAESQAIKQLFDELGTGLPLVSSIKSMLGHTMGAASAIGAISCCLAINDNIVPPTINFETPDPECDLDCVPNVARTHNIEIALNNGFAFGGNNACLVLKRFT